MPIFSLWIQVVARNLEPPNRYVCRDHVPPVATRLCHMRIKEATRGAPVSELASDWDDGCAAFALPIHPNPIA